ncbi:MAG: hypothetical protein KKE30_21705 [Gammaproteobacteria bacterium]|nr:hypothetical protein [Gammaproteobacteria bacterium]MBU1556501.1 hypothetical protein [Gammaproteobacteria bacterium]MBU2072194.1 hypothetical protein [Gammaproteobacteria bacterium]MBU2182056.1 hypothetical protein [Gammaproteobacteria bacterium]MBU2203899.1 hypothetical protein [Gammaproteobacteria bacterium]
MSDKSLNDRITAYKQAFASGEIQTTYQSLVGIVQGLRTEFSKKYKGEFSVASVMHGYIDFSYFYLQNAYLKSHKLKLAIVFNHQHARFELWLLGQTKDVQTRYWEKLKGVRWVNPAVMPEYSIFDVTLLAKPDFDDIAGLSAAVHTAFGALSAQIFSTLQAHG